jgi:translation elongation factor EF-Tu-like GTPase
MSFIDVPGHALFIRNMLAGTGGIDAVTRLARHSKNTVCIESTLE